MSDEFSVPVPAIFAPSLEARCALIKSLIAARKAFAPITKTASNPHFKSKFADLSEVLGAIQPALLANGLIDTGDAIENGESVEVVIRIWHEGGACLQGSVTFPRAANLTAQQKGSLYTYGRRYGTQLLLALAAEDDDGAKASGTEETRKASSSKKADTSIAEMTATAISDGEIRVPHLGELDACKTDANIDEWTQKHGEEIRGLGDAMRTAARKAIAEQRSKIQKQVTT